MRTTRKISIVVVALVVMTVGLALPAQAGTEGEFLSKINASRAASGLAPVSVHSDLAPDARTHSAEMMAAGEIYHTSPLSAVASGWEALAENVGAGPSVDSLHAAFMASSGHRANILGNYNYVGIGVSQSGSGQLWVTVIFMRKGAPAPVPTTTTHHNHNHTAHDCAAGARTGTSARTSARTSAGPDGHDNDGCSRTGDTSRQGECCHTGSCSNSRTGSVDRAVRSSPPPSDRRLRELAAASSLSTQYSVRVLPDTSPIS